jgi:hypothetical protein
MSQPVMDRLGIGSRNRGLCSDLRNSRRIVMKHLWGLGSHSSGRICIRNCCSIRRRKDIVLMCLRSFLLGDGYVGRGGFTGMET